MSRIRVLHIVNDLSQHGGAEMTLLRLLESLGEERRTHAVVTLKPLAEGETIGASIIALGIPMEDLGARGALSMFRTYFRLIRLIRRTRPDVLSAWLYYAALLVSLSSIFIGYRARMIWHIRSLPYVELSEKPARFFTQRILAFLSHRMRVRIITNSLAAMNTHRAIGFSDYSEKWVVIPNAVDPDVFKPDKEMRDRMRSQFGIPEKAIAIGSVGRNVPEKGYPDLFKAIARLNEAMSPVWFGRLHLVIAGRDLLPDDPAIAVSGLQNYQLHILGARNDIPDVLNSFDIFVLPSRSESFPNVLAEAMASALPAVATDVGDCRDVLDAAEYIATGAPGTMLSDRMIALVRMTSAQREVIGARNRARVVQTFTRQRMLDAFRSEFST
ncbi:MAG: glycosyltransferase [Hyphomicrobiales bacterium]